MEKNKFVFKKETSEIYKPISNFIDNVINKNVEKVIFKELDLRFLEDDFKRSAENVFVLEYNKKLFMIFINKWFKVKIGMITNIITLDEYVRVHYLINKIQYIIMEYRNKKLEVYKKLIDKTLDEEGGFYD